MQRELHVFMDLAGQAVLVGRLWARVRGGRPSSSFVYADDWRGRRDAFALSPTLPLAEGQFHSNEALFPAFTDPAPDSWGQRLMRRSERARAEQEGRQPRTLFDIDFLAGVDDRTRLGALRFRDPEGARFLATTGTPAPPLIDLPALLGATDRIDRGRETNNDIALVLAPGTSLGGARPKASVRDKDGRLLVAKFPKRDDDWPVTRWEAVALTLARAAGLTTPQWRFETIARRAVLLLGRFDRIGADGRVPFMSAMTALDATDHGNQRSYLELVDFLRQQGSKPDEDLRQLWRRIVFNVLVSNTDDHLRNHAFLRDAQGWRLSPAYDMNPCPVDVKPRIHALAIDELDGTASLNLALSVAPRFGIKRDEANAIVAEVGAAISDGRQVAKALKLKPGQIDRMASAFEHDDLRKATRAAGEPAPAKGPKKKANTKGPKIVEPAKRIPETVVQSRLMTDKIERPNPQPMLIDGIFPAVVGAKDMLLRPLITASRRHGLQTQIDDIVGPIPFPLLNARCFLDRMTKRWRYEFALPLHLDVTRQLLWGTHMWIPVNILLGVLACAHARLPSPQYSDYCRRLANPDKHHDALTEMAPVLHMDRRIPARFEVPGLGKGNRTVDWVIEPSAGRPILCDAKRRIFDLLK